MRIRDRNDAAAWREFDAIYRPMLRRFAQARGLCDAEVDDVVQHAMLAIHERIDEFDYDPARGRFKGWLRTLVNNRIRNLVRGRREQQAGSATFHVEQQREQTPDALFDRVWLQEHLRHALQCVKVELRGDDYAAFHAHVIDGLSVEQTCQRWNTTANQVYKLKWRITQRLRDQMRDLAGDDWSA